MKTNSLKKVVVLCAAATTTLIVASAASAWTVSMTAQTSLKRTYAWKIEKSVSQAAVTLAPGATADVSYSVTVTPTGSVDSDWAVSGKVTMQEALFEPSPPIVNSVIVTIHPDELAASVTCVPSPFPVDLGDSSLVCDYASALPNALGVRDAHMRAQQLNGNFRNVHTPVDFTNATVTLVDESVAVTDTMGGALGTVNAADGPKTFTYTKTIGPYTAAQCGQHRVDNTAAYVTNDSGSTGNASAAVAVTVTCPPPPPAGSCWETVNPAGNPAVGDNGHPNDPFGGDAVPGGRHTSPGTRGNGPINSDGFYLVSGLLFSDTTPIAYPGGGYVWPQNTTVKYTERGNPQIKISSMAGPHSVIQFQIQAPDDLYANAPKGAAGAIFCGVPPPPH